MSITYIQSKYKLVHLEKTAREHAVNGRYSLSYYGRKLRA